MRERDLVLQEVKQTRDSYAFRPAAKATAKTRSK